MIVGININQDDLVYEFIKKGNGYKIVFNSQLREAAAKGPSWQQNMAILAREPLCPEEARYWQFHTYGESGLVTAISQRLSVHAGYPHGLGK